ncbi:carbohydrate ABC transporter permease [Novisyntrophococcus fermenticellae]|uniref:carbohydrate ABC transporter permease n=1 Tax=Novisyntrophococcus fermenticellae TaxID=2068655 RepID=UPI001E2AECCE|nr:carbohydrate ABC transporter permease [Novisyntrophococcus fermenticellae]
MERRKHKTAYVQTIILVVFACISLYPLLYLIGYSLKTNDEIFYSNPFGLPLSPQWINYVKAITTFDVLTYFKNSVLTTVVSLAGIFTLILPFSYAVARMQWKLKGLATMFISIGLFIPLQVSLIPLSVLIKNMGMANTYGALILPYIAFNIAFPFMILSVAFRALPRELEEAAFIDGASVYRTFFSIMLPLVKPAIASAMLFAALGIWNEYILPTVMISSDSLKTLPAGLATFVGQHSTNWGAMGATMMMASIPTIILYLCFSEKIENSLTVGGAVKG